jgi:hypothetical protein
MQKASKEMSPKTYDYVGLLINQLVPATVLSLLKIAFFKEKLLN